MTCVAMGNWLWRVLYFMHCPSSVNKFCLYNSLFFLVVFEGCYCYSAKLLLATSPLSLALLQNCSLKIYRQQKNVVVVVVVIVVVVLSWEFQMVLCCDKENDTKLIPRYYYYYYYYYYYLLLLFFKRKRFH